MAKRKVNKSQKIRDYIAEHPDQGPSQVARELKQFGITPAHVSNVKAREGSNATATEGAPRRKKRRRVGKRGRRRIAKVGRRSTEAQPVVAAAELIRLCGGVEEAKSALNTAGKIASVLQ